MFLISGVGTIILTVELSDDRTIILTLVITSCV